MSEASKKTIEEIQIQSIEEFVVEISKKTNLYFRGVSNNREHKLIPAIGRGNKIN